MNTKTRVTIDNEEYFKTGDLARYNARGELVHAGRVDFQIKINGQRVETVEVEGAIMAWSPSDISNCLVTKLAQDEDLLIAYIVSQKSDLDIESLRAYCQARLRRYMVPSYFIIIDKFPLNTNGKIDRKQLPLPITNKQIPCVQINPDSICELEEKVHRIWCSILKLDAVPRHDNYFALGGSSLSLMQIFNYYTLQLAPDKELNVLDFFQNPTIVDHIQHLIDSKKKITRDWIALHLTEGMKKSV